MRPGTQITPVPRNAKTPDHPPSRPAAGAGAGGYLDRSLKALARRYPAGFIRLVLGTEQVLFRTIENPEIYLPERRLFQYNALLTAAYGLPAVSTVLYLERRAYRELPSSYTVALAGRTMHSFTYPVVRLWDYEDDIRAGQLRGLAPLLPLVAARKDEATLARTKELILTAEDRSWRTEALSVALTVAERYFDREFLQQFFKEEILMLKEWPIVQDWIREGMEKGMEKGMELGLEKGLATGMERGRREALRESILEVLSERFGPVRSEIVRKLADIEEVAALKTLHRHSLRVGSAEEFAALLEKL